MRHGCIHPWMRIHKVVYRSSGLKLLGLVEGE